MIHTLNLPEIWMRVWRILSLRFLFLFFVYVRVHFSDRSRQTARVAHPGDPLGSRIEGKYRILVLLKWDEHS